MFAYCYLKATVVQIRVTLGHLKGNYRLFFSISKHKANSTELHPKVRKTCCEAQARVRQGSARDGKGWPLR